MGLGIILRLIEPLNPPFLGNDTRDDGLTRHTANERVLNIELVCPLSWGCVPSPGYAGGGRHRAVHTV